MFTLQILSQPAYCIAMSLDLCGLGIPVDAKIELVISHSYNEKDQQSLLEKHAKTGSSPIANIFSTSGPVMVWHMQLNFER